jgi:hypothetical protein
MALLVRGFLLVDDWFHIPAGQFGQGGHGNDPDLGQTVRMVPGKS